jgi:SAM-dependent methyltransferase
MAVSTEARRDALVERMLAAKIGLMDLATIHIGERLGLYAALANAPAGVTSAELAARTGTDERSVREWLEHQAVGELLEVDDPDAAPGERRYSLPPGRDEVLLDAESLNFVAPMARYGVGMIAAMPEILRAFRDGKGVDVDLYGDDVREAQAAINRPVFTHLLCGEWLPAMPDVHARLQADPPARIADVACGGGWSSIAMAKGYPNARIDGFDTDGPAIDLARANAKEAGVEDRVTFEVRDGSDVELAGQYDLVTVFEAIHDMSNPVPVLATMRQLAGDDGAVLVVDERAAEQFTVPGDELERLLYGYSVLLCLPAGMADQPSAATGTVMRPDTLQGYAEEAGFGDVDVLPVEHFQFRLYRLS